MKLSGLLDSGKLPKADSAVVERMPQLLPKRSKIADEPIVQPIEASEQVPEGGFSEVSVDLIDVSPYQPRLNIDEEALQRLADSIAAGTLSDPITVRRKENGRYELIAGERRWRAHLLLNLSTIPYILKDLDDRQTALLALATNTARKDLSDYELGKSFKRLLDEKFVKNVAELVRTVGLSRPQVDRCLDFFKLPPQVIEFLESKPTLFGANCAEIFAGFVEKGYIDLVIQAAQMIYERGMQEQQAITWLKGAATSSRRRAASRDHVELLVGNRPVAEARVEKTKLIISCAKGTKPSELLEKIRLALESAE
ncbi:MAG: ParB/RepB/Spo0J family partition protein [Pseudomonadota bacterium]